jgi:hypothetical protein
MLRLPKSTRIVWTDAICINQKDNEEKSYQVPLMGSIYSLARRVVVWMGHGDLLQTKEAAQCVKFIADACRQHDGDPDTDPDSVERYKNLNLPMDVFTSTVCDGLKQLYDRPWFNRIWCVQEIRLARDAVVLWEEQEILWSDVGLAASWIFDKTVLDDDSGVVRSILSEVAAENADFMYDTNARKLPLLQILRSHREWESTNPRDMVYGLLSLVAPESEAEALKPDYAKSVGDVFADTVLVIIQLYSRLTALAYVTHPEEFDGEDGYRSWAPRWDDPEVAEVIGIPEDDCPWHACAGLPTKIATPDGVELETLCLFGILYDTAATVEVVMNFTNLKDLEEPNDDNDVHPFLPAFEEIERKKPSTEKFDKDNVEWWLAFVRTLTAGLSGTHFVQSMDEQAQEIYLKSFTDFMVILHSQAYRNMDISSVLDTTVRGYQNDAYHVCKQRRFFWTKNGTFGLGPQCMRIGDIVVVLYGGNTPYVLRPRDGKYLFLGQAYVDRIMQGQLVKEVEAGRLQEQVFCLI